MSSNQNTPLFNPSFDPFSDEDKEEYRDHIATVDQEGKRIWLYPKKPKGKLYNARSWVSLLFLVIFLSMPWIKVDGEQFLLFNILERKFVLFGLLFTPQDFHLFVLAMLTFIVFIILFTVVFGRLFCGWVCPQTVFMEMFYRKIEYWIEGDAGEQRRLDSAPWTTEKIRKKALKHTVFFLIALVVSNYFLAYIIGTDQLLKIINEPVEEHLGGLGAILVFSGLFYGVFARLREQVCTTICPYGRLQSVLLVKDSIVIAYDYKRGEPRGKLKKGVVDTNFGDCIDCNLCVAVCPTGIDIRNGTQLECTNCTACVDACNQVMEKVGKPTNLIRYDSMNGIEAGRRKLFTTRVYAYSAVLVGLLVLDIFMFANRGVMESIILRSQGQLYQKVDETHVSNLYTYILINKTNKELPIELISDTPGSKLRVVGQIPTSIPKSGKIEGVFFIEMPNDQLKGRKTPISIHIQSNGKKVDDIETNFMGPN
jgi:cytochrome c oxidase accessory protein FixG